METVNIKFYVDLNGTREREFMKHLETAMVIDYVKIVAADHGGTFDFFHMDGYGSDGIDVIEVAFKSFKDFKDFMDEIDEKWITELDIVSLTSDELLTRYEKQEGSD